MLKLQCPAKGTPDPKIEWTKNGKPIERVSGQAKISAKGRLSMEDLIPSDSGYYMCNVCNIYGCINFTTKVEVNGECDKMYNLLRNFLLIASCQIVIHRRL